MHYFISPMLDILSVSSNPEYLSAMVCNYGFATQVSCHASRRRCDQQKSGAADRRKTPDATDDLGNL